MPWFAKYFMFAFFGRSQPFGIRRRPNVSHIYDFYHLCDCCVYEVAGFLLLINWSCQRFTKTLVSHPGWLPERYVFMHFWKTNWRIDLYIRRSTIQRETWSHVLDKQKLLFDVVPCSSTLQHCVVSILLMLTGISCFLSFLRHNVCSAFYFHLSVLHNDPSIFIIVAMHSFLPVVC